MGYWVYVDDVTNRARLHRGSCKFCNHGAGVTATRRSDNRWEGPFTDPDDAATAAVCADKRDTKPCGHCQPGRWIEGEAISFVIN